MLNSACFARIKRQPVTVQDKARMHGKAKKCNIIYIIANNHYSIYGLSLEAV